MRISRRLARLLACRRGTSILEFGLVGPLALMLVIGVMEVGRLAYTQAALFFAAQEATRFAIVREGQVTDAEIEAFASQQLIGIDHSLAVFTATSPLSNTTGTSLVTVEVSYPFRLHVPFLSNHLITLSAQSRGFYAFPGVPGGS